MLSIIEVTEQDFMAHLMRLDDRIRRLYHLILLRLQLYRGYRYPVGSFWIFFM